MLAALACANPLLQSKQQQLHTAHCLGLAAPILEIHDYTCSAIAPGPVPVAIILLRQTSLYFAAPVAITVAVAKPLADTAATAAHSHGASHQQTSRVSSHELLKHMAVIRASMLKA
jgi:hypothetical protein